MVRSKYDRNIDRGAAQQRNPGQGTPGKSKPGTPAEEPMGTGRHGGSKHQPGSGKRNQDAPWRQKSDGDKE